MIHASKSFDMAGYIWILDNKERLKLRTALPHYKYMWMGGIIGRANLTQTVRSLPSSPWMFGPFGFVMKNPEPIDFVPCRGKLGIFDIDI